jgi:hypothetical protein
LISEYRGKLIPGTYMLNTSYDAEQILQVLANDIEVESETDENGQAIGRD